MNQQTVVYDVKALKIYALATPDVVGGASPTYASGIQLQGVSEVSMTPNIISTEIKGDGGMVIARKGRTDRYMVTFTYGRVGIDAIAAMVGGSVTDVGTGSSEVVTHSLAMPNSLPFFKTEFQIADTDNGVGCLNSKLYKCQLKTATFIDSKTDAFGAPKIDIECIPLLSTGTIGDVIMYATATNISA